MTKKTINKKDPKVLNYRDILRASGLDEKESIIYELLLKNGLMGVGDILDQKLFKRGDLYNILYDLKDKGFVSVKEINGRKHFEANDPNTIKDYLEIKKKQVTTNSDLFSKILPQMLSDYNLFVAKPSVRSYEGEEGLERLYEELNLAKPKEIQLIRSVYDDKWPEMDKIVNRQIKKQIKLKIKTRALTPLVKDTKPTYTKFDEERLVERRIIKKEDFALPAQVLIWNDTVAITSLKGKMITSIIENPNIALTFRVIFDYIWEKSEKDHREIVKSW